MTAPQQIVINVPAWPEWLSLPILVWMLGSVGLLIVTAMSVRRANSLERQLLGENKRTVMQPLMHSPRLRNPRELVRGDDYE